MIEFEEHRFGFKDYRRSEKSQNSRDAQRALLRREEQLLLRFFEEGSSQLKLNRASLVKQGAESSGRLFLTWCSSACRSTCKLRDLKSPAPIPDQGLFCACQFRSGAVYMIPIFEEPGGRRKDYSVNSLLIAGSVSLTIRA